MTPLLITPYDLFYWTSDKYHIDTTIQGVVFLLRNLLAVFGCLMCRSDVYKPRRWFGFRISRKTDAEQ